MTLTRWTTHAAGRVALQSVIAMIDAAIAEGSAIRDIWLLRMRALLAHARGDQTGYRDYRDRYREMATSLGFKGHMQWAETMP